MIKRTSHIVASFFVENDIITKADEEIYIYGLEQIISNVINILTLVVLSTLLHSVVETLIFLLFFVPIRQFAGGYHANSYRTCFSIFIGIYIFTIAFIKYFPIKYMLIVGITIMTVALILIMIFSPLLHPNSLIKAKNFKKYKKISIIIAFVEWVTVLLSFFAFNDSFYNYSFAASVTTFVVSLLMLVSKYKRGRDYSEK